MRVAHFHRWLVAPVTALSLLAVSACNESQPEPPRPTLSAEKGVEAGLVASTLSPATGDTIVVLARLTAGVDVRPAASFSARLSYDAARLTYVGELARADDGMRVINAEIPGDVRVAGIAASGFRTGDLVALRFVMKGSGPAGDIRLLVDQLHATDGEDLGRVVVRPPTVNADVAR